METWPPLDSGAIETGAGARCRAGLFYRLTLPQVLGERATHTLGFQVFHSPHEMTVIKGTT